MGRGWGAGTETNPPQKKQPKNNKQQKPAPPQPHPTTATKTLIPPLHSSNHPPNLTETQPGTHHPKKQNRKAHPNSPRAKESSKALYATQRPASKSKQGRLKQTTRLTSKTVKASQPKLNLTTPPSWKSTEPCQYRKL